MQYNCNFQTVETSADGYSYAVTSDAGDINSRCWLPTTTTNDE